MSKAEKNPEEEKAEFNLTSVDDLWRFLAVLDGVNPEAQQTITDFMDMKDPVEGSNLPRRRDVQFLVYLDICGKFLFPDVQNDPFTVLRDSIAQAFKAKGGEKAKQFVEMVRNQPDLSSLSTMPDDVKRSALDRILGRGKE